MGCGKQFKFFAIWLNPPIFPIVMKLLYPALLVGLLTTGILSCSSYSNWSKTVNNQSTHTLILYTTDSGGGFTFTDSLILAPGASEVIYEFGDELSDANSECEQYISRLSLVADPGFTVTKDIQDPANWVSGSEETGTGYDHTCTFSLTDDDIQ